MTESVSRSAEPAEPRSSVWRWWNDLQTEDRAGRAELRRCATPAEVAFTAPYHRLLQRLGSRLKETDARRVAAIAAVLSHVEREPADRVPLPKAMGAPRVAGGDPVVSDSRFRHLLRSEDPCEILRELVRVVRHLDRITAVDPLFHDLMRWDEATRMRWAREFYEAAGLARKTA